MKALSFREPWATLAVLGLKPVDNRPWRTSYRGPIYIHASDGPDFFPPPFTEAWLLGNLDAAERELFLATPRTRGAITWSRGYITAWLEGYDSERKTEEKP